MAKQGRRIYAPWELITEVQQRQKTEMIKCQAEVMRQIVHDAQIGRQVKQQQMAFAIFSVRRGNNGRS